MLLPWLHQKLLPDRYLWTDAFGVCNFLTLAVETGDRTYLGQADALIAGGQAQPR